MSTMTTLLRAFAYVCIWTTPIHVIAVFWGVWITANTNFGVLSLTNIAVIYLHLKFFVPFIDWMYMWVWNIFLDFVLSLPFILHVGLKGIVSFWLGFWILKKTN